MAMYWAEGDDLMAMFGRLAQQCPWNLGQDVAFQVNFLPGTQQFVWISAPHSGFTTVMTVESFGWATDSENRHLSIPLGGSGSPGLKIQEENLRCTFASLDLPDVSLRLQSLRSALAIESDPVRGIVLDGINVRLDLDERSFDFWSPDQINTPHLRHWCSALLDALITNSISGEVKAALTAVRRYF